MTDAEFDACIRLLGYEPGRMWVHSNRTAWTTKQGEYILLSDMDDEHLRNSIKMMIRKNGDVKAINLLTAVLYARRKTL